MALTFSPKSQEAILQAIEASVNEAVEREMGPLIQEAHDKLDKAIRARMAEYVMRVMSQYDIVRDRNQIMISVRLPGGDQ